MRTIAKFIAVATFTSLAHSAHAGWQYDTTQDKMRGITSKFASLESNNLVPLDFPYQPGTKMTILLRRKGNAKEEVILRVDKGQVPCHFDGCNVSVKFGDGKVQTFRGDGPESHSSDMIFLSSSSSFIKSLRTGKPLIVEVQFYQSGRKQFEFDTAGLKWE
uniref:hypothetical protein n=1 Tax=Cupriavidus yeoncheonensis TaxID=1462994 RepID=UPI003F4999A8